VDQLGKLETLFWEFELNLLELGERVAVALQDPFQTQWVLEYTNEVKRGGRSPFVTTHTADRMIGHDYPGDTRPRATGTHVGD
jgi:hypothetical protein